MEYYVISKVEWIGNEAKYTPIGYTTDSTIRDYIVTDFNDNYTSFLSKSIIFLYDSRHRTSSIEGMNIPEIKNINDL